MLEFVFKIFNQLRNNIGFYNNVYVYIDYSFILNKNSYFFLKLHSWKVQLDFKILVFTWKNFQLVLGSYSPYSRDILKTKYLLENILLQFVVRVILQFWPVFDLDLTVTCYSEFFKLLFLILYIFVVGNFSM